jgi:hypothetical protein
MSGAEQTARNPHGNRCSSKSDPGDGSKVEVVNPAEDYIFAARI